MKSKDEIWIQISDEKGFFPLFDIHRKKKLVVHASGMRYISGILKRQIPVVMLITAYSTAEF